MTHVTQNYSKLQSVTKYPVSKIAARYLKNKIYIFEKIFNFTEILHLKIEINDIIFKINILFEMSFNKRFKTSVLTRRNM